MELAQHMQRMDADKQKWRSQVRRLCQENAWLRDELATTTERLVAAEQKAAALDVECEHLRFMKEVSKYDEDKEDKVSKVGVWL